MKTVQEISEFVGGALRGDRALVIRGVASLERAGAGTLAYAEEKYMDRIAASGASCVLVSSGEFPGRTVIVVENPRVAFARVAQWMFPRELPSPGIHPTAIVDPGARIGDGVAIGAWTLVESGARVGRRTVLYPGCYVGKGCRVGDDCVLFPRVVLYPDTDVGDRVTIHAGVVIGSDGFGFVFDGARQVKIPQVGRAIIASDVEIGANTCVDRGALDQTVVGEGVKIDNLCQIGHNVRIGEHSTLSAQTGIAGSASIGRRATIAGQVGVGDYCTIEDRAVVGAHCGVLSRKRVPAGSVYWGTPARPIKDVKIQNAHLSRLPKLAAEVKRLREEIDALRARLGSDDPGRA